MPRRFSAWPLLEAAYRFTPRPMLLFVKRTILPKRMARKIRFWGQKPPPPHLDPHSLPMHTAETLPRIATMLSGPAARAVHNGEIRDGFQNAGIIIYRIEGPGQPRREIIEKKTIRQPEAMLCHCFHKAGIRFAAHDLVPTIYRVTRSERRYHIFMERLRYLGPPADIRYGLELAETLAHDILRFSRAVQELMDYEEYVFPLRNATEHYRHGMLRALVTSSGDRSLLKLLATVEDELSRCEPIMSHNDLHWGNISFSQVGDGRRLRFIDFNSVGPNIPGAELYAFAREARRNSNVLSFFQKVSATYASLSGVPVHLVRMAAYLDAAQRFASERRFASAAKRAQLATKAFSLLIDAQRELSSSGRDPFPGIASIQNGDFR